MSQMESRRYREPSPLAITIKSIVFAGLVGILLMFMLYTISYVSEESRDASDKAWINDRCNQYYHEGRYGELYDYLILYDMYNDEDFAMYKEMVDGYLDYCQYEMWAAVPAEQIEGREERMEQYKQQLLDRARNCQYDTNKTKLEAYAKACE